ncbi:unnamed protein product [Diplocarpon coronariae]
MKWTPPITRGRPERGTEINPSEGARQQTQVNKTSRPTSERGVVQPQRRQPKSKEQRAPGTGLTHPRVKHLGGEGKRLLGQLTVPRIRATHSLYQRVQRPRHNSSHPNSPAPINPPDRGNPPEKREVERRARGLERGEIRRRGEACWLWASGTWAYLYSSSAQAQPQKLRSNALRCDGLVSLPPRAQQMQEQASDGECTWKRK